MKFFLKANLQEQNIFYNYTIFIVDVRGKNHLAHNSIYVELPCAVYIKDPAEDNRVTFQSKITTLLFVAPHILSEEGVRKFEQKILWNHMFYTAHSDAQIFLLHD